MSTNGGEEMADQYSDRPLVLAASCFICPPFGRGLILVAQGLYLGN